MNLRSYVLLALVVSLPLPRYVCAQAPSGTRPSSASLSPAVQQAIEQLSEQLKARPSDILLLARRAELYAASGIPRQAIEDYDRLIRLAPDRAAFFDARGSERFKLGQIDESLADFDRAIALQPDQEPWHWKRGISYYYAERWDEGRKQFEGYQTVDDNDVENAVWRFLCMARASGIEAARSDMLKIKRDRRIPMSEVYELYLGKLQPDQVLSAAAAGDPTPAELNQRNFYAQLYLGLYYEVLGDAELAKEHLRLAKQHKIAHYMWNVADVRLARISGEGISGK